MKTFRLSNGIYVIYEENKRNIVACSVFLPMGSLYDAKEGITYLSLKVGFKPPEDYIGLMEGFGSPILVDTSNDYSVIMFQTLSEGFSSYVNIVDRLLKRKHLERHDFDVERKALLLSLRSRIENPFSICYERLLKLTYRGTPYEKLPYGTVESISRITFEDADSWFKRWFLPKGSIISISGSVNPKDIDCALKVIEGFETKELSKIAFSIENPESERVVVKRPQSTQSFIMLALPAPSVDDSSFVPFKLLNAVLGEGTGSILFRVLRERMGYAYSLGSFFPSRKFSGRLFLFAGTSLEKRKSVEDEIIRIKLNLENFIDRDSLERSRNYVKGTYIMDHDTNLKKSWYNGFWQTMKGNYRFDREYLNLIDRVKLEDIVGLSRKLSKDTYQMVVTDE